VCAEKKKAVRQKKLQQCL